jgi:hypothetical protein
MRSIALTLLLGAAVNASAQSPFEYADQRSSGVSYIGCVRSGSTWVACGSSNGEHVIGSPRFAQGFHTDGTPAWQTDLINSTYFMMPADMIPATGGGVLVVGPHDGCDVGLPTSLLMSIDDQGSVTWANDLWFENAQHLDQALDGRILISTYSHALITDQFGDSLLTLDLDTIGLPSMLWMNWDEDSTVLVVRHGGVVERRSLEADVLATTNSSIPALQDVINWNGHRLALEQTGMLHVLDAALVELNVLPLGAPFTKGQFIPGDSSLWVIGNQVAVELDTALSILRTVVLDPDAIFDDLTFLGFAVDGDTIAMAGTAVTAQLPAGLIRTVIADGSVAVHDEDVSISIESIDTTWYELMGAFVYPRASVTLRVTNEGSGIVENVVVNHFSVYWICEAVERTVHLSGLNLAPGASITAVLDSLWLNYAPWAWVNTNQQFCISALSPNNLYDRDQSDNLACDTAHIVLGMEDPGRPPFSVFHDLQQERLELRFHGPTTTPMDLQVLDLSGRMHATTRIAAGTSAHSLGTTGLAQGIYLLSVQGPQARWTVKWVKP